MGSRTETWPDLLGRTGIRLPTFQRRRPVFPDPFGFKSSKVKLDPAWVGQTLYFQWWFKDPTTSFKVGLSDALEVVVYP